MERLRPFLERILKKSKPRAGKGISQRKGKRVAEEFRKGFPLLAKERAEARRGDLRNENKKFKREVKKMKLIELLFYMEDYIPLRIATENNGFELICFSEEVETILKEEEIKNKFENLKKDRFIIIYRDNRHSTRHPVGFIHYEKIPF